MHPNAFNIWILHIQWYGIMAAVGFLVAVSVLQANRQHVKMSKAEVSDVGLFALIAGVLGARILYVMRFWDTQFKYQLGKIIRIDEGGLVFFGGFILATLFLIIYAKKKKISLMALLDIFAPALAIGHAFGRIGCFLNGCCFGKPCDASWAVTFPKGSIPATKYPDISIHPVQLYETAENFILFIILYFCVKKLKKGQTAAIYLTSYGMLRFTNEFFRGDHHQVDIYYGLTPAQIKALIFVPIGIIWFIVLKVNAKNNSKKKTKK